MKIAHLVFRIENRTKKTIPFIFRNLFILDLIIILLLSPQTPQDNILIDEFNESGIFTDYGEAKEFLHWLTWGTIGLFIFARLIK